MTDCSNWRGRSGPCSNRVITRLYWHQESKLLSCVGKVFDPSPMFDILENIGKTQL